MEKIPEKMFIFVIYVSFREEKKAPKFTANAALTTMLT